MGVTRWKQPEQGVVFRNARNTVRSVGKDHTLDSRKNVKRNKSKSFGAYNSKFLGGLMIKTVSEGEIIGWIVRIIVTFPVQKILLMPYLKLNEPFC